MGGIYGTKRGLLFILTKVEEVGICKKVIFKIIQKKRLSYIV